MRPTALLVTLTLFVTACNGATEACEPDRVAGWTVARHWNEATLDAIRRDVPAPTVHARNLFHSSAAMWDAWAAYDETAVGYFVDVDATAEDVTAAREEALSYAAFRVLEARYVDSVGAGETLPALDGLMADLCLDPEIRTTEGDDPASLGNRIGKEILAVTLEDGSNELGGYEDPTYEPVNPPLIVDQPGAGDLVDPNRWQPLQLEEMVSQNGIPVRDESQEFIDPHWGGVDSFALPDPGPDLLPIDPGPPPYQGDPGTGQAYKDDAVEVVSFSALLGPNIAPTVDISPATLGNNSLGENDGSGWGSNPVTGEPYEPNEVNEADFARVLAEFWADGPDSETPPGHWNTMANAITEQFGDDLLIGGTEPVDPLEWDVKLYFTLAAANHDAAVAAWGAKGHYDYIRPISMIRWMGGLGQSTDTERVSYHPDGLPLVYGLVEVVTEESSQPGERHEQFAEEVGRVVVWSWRGTPADPENDIGGVGWIRAVDWVPYQKPTFVTPSFAGYVSGHSTFSRASAAALTGFTGSPYFPDGLGEWTIEADSLEFEAGPSTDITLQWATYADAADQAGLSRLYGGIHVKADDRQGRIMGDSIGTAAWEKARTYFDGSVGG